MLKKKVVVLGCDGQLVLVSQLNEFLNSDQGGDGFKVVVFAVGKERFVVGKECPHDHS